MAAELPTFDALYGLGKAEATSRRPDLTDWSEGSANDAVIGAGAVLADETIRIAVDLFAALFLDTAEGEDLDALAADRFNLTRKPATPAIVTVTWTRSATGAYTIPAGTRIRARANGQSVIFTTDADAALPLADTSVDIPATCTDTGRVGNVAAGTIIDVMDPVPVDPGATVTNAERASGGTDAETDAVFRDRIRRYFPTLRRGTVAALQAGALSVPGVSYVAVDEGQIETTGRVLVYVGDPDGAGNELLADAVAAELEDWRAAGVLVDVLPSVREEVVVELSVRVRAGVDTPTLRTAITAAATAYVDALPPNATLYLSQLEHAALGVSSDVLDAVVSDPAVNLEPSAPQNAIRFAPGGFTVHFVEV